MVIDLNHNLNVSTTYITGWSRIGQAYPLGG